MIDRYTKPEMKPIWTDRRKFEGWLESCWAVVHAQCELGEIGSDICIDLAEADFDVERVHELDKKYKQDFQAFVDAVKEVLRQKGVQEETIVHFGNRITSYDAEDPAFMLQIIEAGNLIIQALKDTIGIFKRRAVEFEYTLMLMITHGQPAGPGYLGLRICNWVDALENDLVRIETAIEKMCIGKFSGIIGVYGELSPEHEQIACEYMGLNPARITTQIIHRAFHGELMSALSICAANIEHIENTLWLMCHYPACEAREYFDWVNQRGSTGMPHKKNPWQTERLIGMASLVRGYELAVKEQIKTPEERAISQSSVERVAWPDATTIVHFMIVETGRLMEKMEFFPDNMKHNLDALNGVIFAQHVKDLLRQKGIHELRFNFTEELLQQMARHNFEMECETDERGPYKVMETYEWAKFCVYLSWDMETNRSIRPFRDVLVEQGILGYLTTEELDECFDYKRGLKYARDIYERFDLPRIPS